MEPNGAPNEGDESGVDPLVTAIRRASPFGPGDAAAAWRAVERRLRTDSPFAARWTECLGYFLRSADPELALATWVRWIEDDLAADEDSGHDARTRAGAWDASGLYREGFARIAGASPALGNLLLRHWEHFAPDSWGSGWVTSESLARRVASLTRSLPDDKFLHAVRTCQRLETLRIAYLDCVQDLPVDQVALQVSTVADVLIAACHDRAMESVARKQGKEPPRRGFAVLAFGKLGGQELNYSSDVDLSFVYDESIASLRTVDGTDVGDPQEVERFYTLVGERLVHLISAFTDLGRLYRFDARLRPGGSSSRLVWSARAAVDYYYSVGRAWERQALIRMRAIAGDFDLARRLATELDAFTFPRDLTQQQVAEIRGLKRQMERMAADRGPSEEQIKIGRGGIRDVEYIVQYLQLVHGSRIPALKAPNVFRALEVLDREGLLKPEEADVLRRGYRFLRRLEHRIQLDELRQTHRLPEDPRALTRIARSMGLPTAEALRTRLSRNAANIRRVYSLLFEDATSPREEGQELRTILELPLEVTATDGAELLKPFGFTDPAGAYQRLHALANPPSGGVGLDAARSREVLARLAGRLLREISLQPEPDRTLSNFEECVGTLGARSVFYQLLDENSSILRLFVEICGRSSLLVETLRTHPDIFDEVVDCLLTGYSFTRESLVTQLEAAAKADGPGWQRELLKLKHLHVLLIAIRDLMRMANLSVTLLDTSVLSEAILEAVLSRSLREAAERLGSWRPPEPRFAVLGLGKLGGQEMGYKSDLDLVIIYSGDASTEQGVQASEFFERLAQLLSVACGAADNLGPLLRIDLRLRPLGSHNSLAISLDAWKQYFRSGGARNWERQAFLRARPVAGDVELGAEIQRFIRAEIVLGGPAGPASRSVLLEDVREMRRKIEAHARTGDLKKGAGGIVDVEFLVQALQLLHGREHPEVVVPNTPAGIRALRRAGALDDATASELLTSYQFLRWLENRISLVAEGGQPLDAMPAPALESLVQKIGYRSSGEESAAEIFRGELDYYRTRNRALLERTLSGAAERPVDG